MKTRFPNFKHWVLKQQTFLLTILLLVESACIIIFTSDFNSADQSPSPTPEKEQIVSYPKENAILKEVKEIPQTDDSNENELRFEASDPKLIIIPTINVNVYIEQVGINEANEIAVPAIEGSVGWYIYSVKPGEKGLSIIDGHVDSTSGAGVFRNLKDLQIDDTFLIEYGDGSSINFKVVDKKQVSVGEANTFLFSKRSDIDSQLNLITCGGNYNPDERSYDERVIVVAEKLP